MGIDVTAETRIRRRPEEVWSYATDPANDPVWIGGITSASVVDGTPQRGQGSRVARVARFMGRRIEYINEVTGHDPPRRLEMRSVKSPFPMRVTYTFEEDGERGGTVARIRVEGTPSMYYGLLAPLLAPGVRRSITGDLRRLKRIMESTGEGEA